MYIVFKLVSKLFAEYVAMIKFREDMEKVP